MNSKNIFYKKTYNLGLVLSLQYKQDDAFLKSSKEFIS